MKVVEVYKSYYEQQLNRLKNDLSCMLDEDIVANKYYLVFENGEVIGGFATTLWNELKGLFSLKKGKGRELFKKRLEVARNDSYDASRAFVLVCYDGPMRKLAEEYGFVPVKIEIFNPELACSNWNLKKYGTPDVYYMELKTDDKTGDS